MFVENFIHLGVEVCSSQWVRVTGLILQLHLNLALELVIFGEYRYHRNFKNFSRQFPGHKAVFERTVLVRANVAEMLYIQRWSIIVHRNAVP